MDGKISHYWEVKNGFTNRWMVEKFLKKWVYQPVDGDFIKIFGFLYRMPTAGWHPGYHPGEVTLDSVLSRMVDGILIRRMVPDGWMVIYRRKTGFTNRHGW